MRRVVALLALVAGGAHAQESAPNVAHWFLRKQAHFSTGKGWAPVADQWYPQHREGDGERRLALAPENQAPAAIPPFPLRFESVLDLDAVAQNERFPEGPSDQVVNVSSSRYAVPLQYRATRTLIYVRRGTLVGWLPFDKLPRGFYLLGGDDTSAGWWFWCAANTGWEALQRHPETRVQARAEMDRRGVHPWPDAIWTGENRDVGRVLESGAALNRAVETYVSQPHKVGRGVDGSYDCQRDFCVGAECGRPPPGCEFRRMALFEARARVRRESVDHERTVLAAYGAMFASAAGLLAGAPVPEELSATMKPSTLAARNRFKAATVRSSGAGVDDELAPVRVAPAPANRVATAPDEALFWSGKTGNVYSEKVAPRFARVRRLKTIDMLITERGVTMPEYNRKDPVSKQAWENLSKDFARGASGTVRAVIGEELNPAGCVWLDVELPALRANPSVTRIITIDPATGVETTIFTRGTP